MYPLWAPVKLSCKTRDLSNFLAGLWETVKWDSRRSAKVRSILPRTVDAGGRLGGWLLGRDCQLAPGASRWQSATLVFRTLSGFVHLRGQFNTLGRVTQRAAKVIAAKCA